MKRLTLTATFAAAMAIAGSIAIAQAKDVHCEIMLKALRATVSAAKLNDADRAEISELEAKGVERCNADDDKRADVFLTNAIRIIGNFPSVIDPPT